MSSKKKKTTANKVAPIESEPIELEPAEELPTRQLEESSIEQTTEPVEQPAESEPVAEAESQSIVEVIAESAPEVEPEKSAEIEPQPVVEPLDSNESPHVPVLGPKPKNLSMSYLQEEIDYLTYQITELLKNPVRQRRPVESSKKVQMLDKISGKIYPSKNNLYLTMLKSGELKELVDKGIFGSNPEKNTFGVYALLRSWPTRFEIVKPEETNI